MKDCLYAFLLENLSLFIALRKNHLSILRLMTIILLLLLNTKPFQVANKFLLVLLLHHDKKVQKGILQLFLRQIQPLYFRLLELACFLLKQALFQHRSLRFY